MQNALKLQQTKTTTTKYRIFGSTKNFQVNLYTKTLLDSTNWCSFNKKITEEIYNTKAEKHKREHGLDITKERPISLLEIFNILILHRMSLYIGKEKERHKEKEMECSKQIFLFWFLYKR